MGKAHIMRIVLLSLVKLMNIIYIPLFIKRLFVRKKECPPIDNNILLLPATTLAEKIRKRQVSSETVIRAYIKRIEEVNPVINAVVEDRFSAAIHDAITKDKFLRETQLTESELRQRHPLLGLPLTVKGSIALQGLAYNAGSRVRDVKATEDATIVRLAKEAGAVPLLVSNTPELCMNWETTNKVTGTTRNPHDTTRTAGGSSGGEAALLASAASVLALGSDIAGSLRLPAHFCGVLGHKPSPGTVCLDGHFPDCADKEAWERVFILGPMARYVEDLCLLFTCILKPEKRDLLNLDEPVNLRNMKVYYIENHKTVVATRINKNVKQAMHRVIAHLASVCDSEPQVLEHPGIDHSSELSYLKLLDIDGIENVVKANGEGVYTELMKFVFCSSKYSMVPIFYGFYKRLLHRIFKRHIDKDVNDKVEKLRAHLIKILDENSVFICPSFISEAPQHGDIYRNVLNLGYLSIFNVLGFPVTNCPISYTKKGLPVGVQVAAAPNCDRLTLAMARELEREFGGWQAPVARTPTLIK